MSTSGDYKMALRLGREQYQKDLAKGVYPYLQVLEDLTHNLQIEQEVSLGQVIIPIDQIVGTNGVGRSTAFARNFMPLLDEGSEFARKWMNLNDIHLKEGIRDPIKAYEFMNRFYVVEGNKRVSVLKFYGAVEISGIVTRVIAKPDGSKASRIYQEFLRFYKIARINYLNFTREGSYDRILELTGRSTKAEWDSEFQKEFHFCYSRIQSAFKKPAGPTSGISPSDVFLEYLKIYPLSSISESTDQELRERLEKIRDNIELLQEEAPVGLHLEPQADKEQAPRSFVRVLQDVFITPQAKPKLRVAFAHSKTMETSAWTYAHELGRMYVEESLKDQIKITDVDNIFNKKETPYQTICDLAGDNDVVFTTTPQLIDDTVKAAVRFPSVKFLNCSVNMAVGNIRTYYGREYEAKFLSGILAGVMTQNDRIAYIADYPISGMIASINAFSRGVQLVNPRAKVFLIWSTMKGVDVDSRLSELDCDMVSHQDMITPGRKDRRFGLYQVRDRERKELAMPFWNWGIFYEKILSSILSGSWSDLDRDQTKAINYWWGLSAGVIDLVYSSRLPEGVTQLMRYYKRSIIHDFCHVFDGFIYDQQGTLRSEEDGYMPTGRIVTMDWLINNVVGQIPEAGRLNLEAQDLVETTEEGGTDSEGMSEI